MKIGEKIKRIRLHRHMKQRELGELVGFTDGAANSSGTPSRGVRAAGAGYRQSGRYYGNTVLVG